jgi:hypothetical protein
VELVEPFRRPRLVYSIRDSPMIITKSASERLHRQGAGAARAANPDAGPAQHHRARAAAAVDAAAARRLRLWTDERR